MSKQTVTESDLRALIDSATEYEIVMTDPSGTILLWNKGAERLKGYTAAEAVGRNLSSFYTDADGKAGLSGSELAQALQAGRLEVEGWRTGKDGRRSWTNIVTTPVRDSAGKHIGFAVISRDLTERAATEQKLSRQRDEILELSTPVIQVWDKILALPIIGTLDSQRAARLTESLLLRISQDEAEFVIIDISGVPTVDSQVAQHLLKTVQGARLMGAESILSGVRPETAQAMVHLGVDVGTLKSRSTLRDALQLALSLRRQLKGELVEV